MTPMQSRRIDPPGRTLSAELLHDLRTPLNQILGYSEMLTEQAIEEGQTGFVPDLQKIQVAGHRLLALLNADLTTQTDVVPEAEGPADAVTAELRRSETGSDAAARRAMPNIAQAAILVVDDSTTNRDMLARRLERHGHLVAKAGSGCEALEAMRAQAFDLVLLDLMMPEMDGFAVLQHLKNDEALRPIPVIMISALDELDSVARCIEMGAEDYLPKPSNPILLKARIEACLEKKRTRERERYLLQLLQQNSRRLEELEKLRDALTHTPDELLNA